MSGITKTAGGVTTTYFYDGNTLTGENRSDGKRLRYFYDATGLCGFSYFDGSNTKYYTYVKDVLGNIVMIKDHLGLLMTKYTYDEWGNCTVNNLVGTIGNVNPFRYRGYYFDTESGLYYLMSRYYDPEIGQFISMDTSDYLDPETIGGVDLYAYGLNNPIMYVDPTGHSALGIFLTWVGIGLFAGGILGAISAVQSQTDIGRGFLVGALLGGVIGAAVGLVFAAPAMNPLMGKIAANLGSKFLQGGVKAISGKFVADLTGLAFFNKKMGSLESYMSAFVFGGTTGAIGLSGKVKMAVDVFARPAYNILIDDILFKGDTENWKNHLEKYAVNVAIRGITYGVADDWKAIYRGLFNGFYSQYLAGSLIDFILYILQLGEA